MALHDIIRPNAILATLAEPTKKGVLMAMSEKAEAVSGLSARLIFDTVFQRERLGSTGIGDGVAVPHGRLARCPRIVGVFARLETPIDFEAQDDAPVDLVLLLLTPDASGADHLSALARTARTLRDPHIARTIRGTRDAAAIHTALTAIRTPNAA